MGFQNDFYWTTISANQISPKPPDNLKITHLRLRLNLIDSKLKSKIYHVREKSRTHGKITFKPLYDIKLWYIQWFTREFVNRERTHLLRLGLTDTCN